MYGKSVPFSPSLELEIEGGGASDIDPETLANTLQNSAVQAMDTVSSVVEQPLQQVFTTIVPENLTSTNEDIGVGSEQYPNATVNVDEKIMSKVMKAFTFRSHEFKSSLQPPKDFFKVAWFFLYILYASMLAITWQVEDTRNSLLLGLLFNLLWVPAFMYNSALGVAVICVMIYFALDSYIRMGKDGFESQRKFFIAYIVWLFFALFLNTYIALKSGQVVNLFLQALQLIGLSNKE
jgi:tryptophan-rich sensory protein